jgi:nicotinamidase-related amidase
MRKLIFIILILFVFSCASKDIRLIEYDNPQKALLVIDMQIDYVDENGKFPIEKSQIEYLLSIINVIINDYNSTNYHIIYMRNIFRENDWKNIFRNYAVIEGSSGVEIDPRINIVSKNIFDKYTPNALSNNELINYLQQNMVNEIYLCGVLADVGECVYETAIGALYRGYKVNYIANAVGSSSIKNIKKAVLKLENKGINIIEY